MKNENIILANLKEGHPRLFIKSFDEFSCKIRNDERAGKWYETIIKFADELIEKECVQYIHPTSIGVGHMTIPSARPFFERVYTLSLAYKLEGDKKYLERLWLEVEHVANFPDWDPVHYLTIAEFLHGMAIAYDWLFYDWTEKQKSIILNSIKKNGLSVGLEYLNGNIIGINWTVSDSNWGIVCNAGNTLAALAIADEEPIIAAEIIDKCIDLVKKSVVPYGPDGGYREGCGYWGYATNYLTYYMAALESAVKDGFLLPDKYDLSTWAGVSETGDYCVYISGPVGAFNYGDATPLKVSSPALYWLANKFKKPSYAYYQARFTDNYKSLVYAQPLVVDLMWYDPNNCYLESNFPLDKKFTNTADVLLRSSFKDDAIFVGAKGGSNQAPHGFLNIGSFVLEALGERFGNGSIMGDYTWYGYFGALDRYNYYVASAEGNNCLVFNPTNNFTQNPLANTNIDRFETAPSNAFGIINTWEAYRDYTKKAKRGIKIFDNRSRVVIQDEIFSDTYNEVWWFMHTGEDILFSDDCKTALLSQNGKQILAKIVSPIKAKFLKMDAKPLPGSVFKPNQANSYGTKLAIKLENVKDFTLAVEFEPVVGEKMFFKNAKLISLDKWKAQLIEEIEFESQLEFDFKYQSDSLEKINISLGEKKAYIQNYESVKKVVSSGAESSVFVAKNTVNGNYGTRWSVGGKQWATFQFESPIELYAVGIATFKGSERKQYFSLEASSDGETFRKFFDGGSSGNTNYPEVYEANIKNVSLVRLNCFGNSINMMNGFTEVRFYNSKKQLEADKTNWENYFNPNNAENNYVIGQKFQVFVSGIMKSGIEVDLANVTYTSSNEKVAVVSNDGIITTITKGESFICASSVLDNIMRIERVLIKVK